jgi:hypothetical protein
VRALERKPLATIEPLAVSDASAFASIGLTSRQFRRWLVDANVPHRKVGRRTIALAEHVRAALGATSTPAPALRRVELVRLAAGGGR